MLQKNRPSGYFSTFNVESGKKIEGETRQCIHCQYTWIYQPGSGRKRGWCIRCQGLLCGQYNCMKYCINVEQRLKGQEKLQNWVELVNSFRGATILGKTSEKRE